MTDLITTHLNADFDGLASMVAGRKLYPGAILALPAGAQETVRNFLAVHDLGLTRGKDVDLSQVRRLVLMDTQAPDRIGPFKALCGDSSVAVHVYDHHPLVGESLSESVVGRAELATVESVGATVTLLVERLQAAGISLTPFEATLLALGLYDETGSLAFTSTTPRDLDAAAWLLRAGADLNMVTETLRRPLDPQQIALLNDLVHNGELYYVDGRKVLIATSTYDGYHGDLAEAVQKLAEMQGLDAVLAAITLAEKVEVIGRSRREDIELGQLARELGGGGHAVAASATVKGCTLVEVRDQLVEWLTERSRPALLARDVMTSPAKVVPDHTTLGEVDVTMTKYEVNAMPVVDGRNRYRGIITREVVQKALFHRFHTTPVVDFMQTDALTATPTTAFREIEAGMVERNQRFVPVMNPEHIVIGVITRTDLLRTLHHDVLAMARAKDKGEPFPPDRRRNVRGLLQDRLPPRVCDRLRQAGQVAERMDVAVYAVGGFVRDLLLGRPNLDVDLVVEGDGIAFARGLATEWGAEVQTHDRFGTAVMTLPEGLKLDVATARIEYYEYPTALPTVERSSIKKDLYRRDFTINTLVIYLNPSRFGELLDFYGGQRDLKDKTIRVLHNLSFVEDPTRVFRAVRFAHRYGFRLGKETLALIKGATKMDLFHRLSGARLLTELMLLLSEDEPRQAVQRLAELDLLRFLHPHLKRPVQWDTALKPVEDVLDWYRLLYLGRPLEGWLVYVMALMDPLPPPAVRDTLRRLQMPERHAEKIRLARAQAASVLRALARRPPPQPAEVYRALSPLSDEIVLFLMAKTKSDVVKRHVSNYLTTYRSIKPSLTGDHLKALGVQPGPIYARILHRLLQARLNGDVRTESEERALVQRLLTGSQPRSSVRKK